MGIRLTQTQLIPTNVVEVGNELSQDTLNGLAASGISASDTAATMYNLVYQKIPKTVPMDNGCLYDYAGFKAVYLKELLVNSTQGQFYIPAR